MILFFSGLLILILGYFTYGRFVRSVLKPEDRKTPAVRYHDGIDYIVLPHWKNMLIQLLNIAGIGPVVGVILGIKFGAIAFLIIPIGNIVGGSVYDFSSGMMSLRHRGMNLPNLIKLTLGSTFYRFFGVLLTVSLLLVVTVFINVPAHLLDVFFPQYPLLVLIISLIFLYYILATLLPVDKIIGNLYPYFGGMLLIGTAMIFISIIWYLFMENPQLLDESEAFKQGKITTPIIPCLFVTIACGILSGFHATQSPIIARTMTKEQEAYSSFYGMMVVEGLIAMVWAAAGMAIYNLFPELMKAEPTVVLMKTTDFFLGKQFGALTILAVVTLAITTGDTALRSLRLCLAEMLKINQKKLGARLAIVFPLIVIISGLLYWSSQDAKSFGYLWNYFSWANQVIASSTLMAVSVWIFRQRKNGWVTMIPFAFITFIVLTFILWTSEAHGGPVGFGLPLYYSYGIAAVLTFILMGRVLYCAKKRRNVSSQQNLHKRD